MLLGIVTALSGSGKKLTGEMVKFGRILGGKWEGKWDFVRDMQGKYAGEGESL